MAGSGELSKSIYLDYNATTPVDPRVLKALIPFLQGCFGNPSSKHALGVEAASAVAEARASVAHALGTSPQCVVFTSGATESINWALRSAAKLKRLSGPRSGCIVTCAMEHPAVLTVCEALRAEEGFEVRLCPVNAYGLVKLDALQGLLTPETVVISIPLANGEIGAVQPISEVVSLARRLSPNAVVHTDASQAMGKVPVHPEAFGVDLMTFAGHKMYAPKGVGALYIREGLRLPEFVLGGGQERGFRGGTENVAFIAALAKACQLVQQSWTAPQNPAATDPAAAAAAAPAAASGGSTACESPKREETDIPHPSHLGFVAKVFLEALWEALTKQTGLSREQLSKQIRVNGPLGSSSPEIQRQWLQGTLHVSIRGADAMRLTRSLSEEECLCVSAGVSCHQGGKASGTLVAMGVPDDWALGSLRISMGRGTTVSQAVCAAQRLARYLVSHRTICSEIP